MNNIVLTGNLTQDINNPTGNRQLYGQTKEGKTFYGNSLAINMGYYDSSNTWVDKVEFFNIRAYGSLAEAFAKNYAKGDGVLVQGEMRAEPYQTQDGRKNVNYYVLVTKVERSNKRKVENNQAPVQAQPTPQSVPPIQEVGQPIENEDFSPFEEGLPFA